MDEIIFRLDQFEGPMDLLLDIVKKNKGINSVFAIRTLLALQGLVQIIISTKTFLH